VVAAHCCQDKEKRPEPFTFVRSADLDRVHSHAAEYVLTVASAGRLRQRVEPGRSQLGADLTQGVPRAIALALGAHHLLDTEAGPSFPIFEDNAASAAGTVNSFGVEVLQPYGQFAIRRGR
jgi:hypothetical protein